MGPALPRQMVSAVCAALRAQPRQVTVQGNGLYTIAAVFGALPPVGEAEMPPPADAAAAPAPIPPEVLDAFEQSREEVEHAVAAAKAHERGGDADAEEEEEDDPGAYRQLAWVMPCVTGFIQRAVRC